MLINSRKSKEAKIGVIGLGYVGLPLAMCFSEEGLKTIGFDIDEEKVNLLNDGKSYIKNIPAEKITAGINACLITSV